MPQLGETVVEGTITKWLKQEGDTVDRDEPLFEISTDKVDTEVPSPLAGTVSKILVPEGETVSVGTELALIETGASDSASGPAEAPAAPDAETSTEPAAEAQAARPAPAPVAEAAAPAPAGSAAPTPLAPAPATTAPPAPATTAPPVPVQPGGNGQAADDGGPMSTVLSPLVRRLAEENQVDLSRVRGTGTGGRITKRDVLAFVESGPSAAPAAAPTAPAPAAASVARAAPQAGEEIIPLTRMRQAIATHMVASMQTSARAWNAVEVNMENVVRTREAAKDAFKAREGIGLTFMPFVARAVVDALAAYPYVNAELRDDAVVLKHYVNLGIAVALDDGLIVPVIKGADTMNLVGLARAINDIATRARSKRLTPDEVHGSTFTITNPGPFGSLISVPIINQPNCAILAFDTVQKRPVVVDDAIAIRHMVYLSMSWDHRIIDGATAALFLARLKQNLETWDFAPEVGLPPASA
jgi:2-oxoglutarate dehydrogenase E2 component (dihydrolipoamide succinyltransferase)